MQKTLRQTSCCEDGVTLVPQLMEDGECSDTQVAGLNAVTECVPSITAGMFWSFYSHHSVMQCPLEDLTQWVWVWLLHQDGAVLANRLIRLRTHHTTPHHTTQHLLLKTTHCFQGPSQLHWKCSWWHVALHDTDSMRVLGGSYLVFLS